MKNKKKTKLVGDIDTTRGEETQKKQQKKIGEAKEEEKEEERGNLHWGLCHPSPRRSASVSHSFFLVYFCDAWFVCHHP